MLAQKSYIDKDGKLAIPSKIRTKLKLKFGDAVSMNCTDNELIISTFRSKLEKARKILSKYPDLNLPNELKSLRREDAANSSW